MARRRVQAQNLAPVGQEEAFPPADILSNLGDVAALLQQEQGLDPASGIAGTAQDVLPPQDFAFPQTPANPELVGPPQEQLPEGLDLLMDLVQAEGQEDSLDAVAETQPPPDAYPMFGSTIPDPSERPDFLPQQPDPSQGSLFDRTIPELEVPPPVDPGVALPEEAVLSPDAVPPIPREEQPQIPEAVKQVIATGTVENVTEADIPTEGLQAMEGAAEVAQSDPKLVETVKNLLRLKEGTDIPPQAWENISMMENILTKEEDQLTQLEADYKSKLETDELTNFDKMVIGIALALPVIIALTYGKDAFLSFSGGALKGLGESLSKAEVSREEDREKLTDIQGKKQKNLERKAQLKLEVLKYIDNPGMRKFLNNYDILDVVEDENGEPRVYAGKDAIVVGDSLGITAKDADKALFYDANNLRDDDDVNVFKTKVSEGRTALGKMKDANKTVDEVLDLMRVIEAQQPGMWNTIAQNYQPALIADKDSWTSWIPFSSNAVTVDIIGEDGVSRSVQALPLLRQKITAMQDVYNKEYLGGNRLTKNLLQHWKDIFPDPSAIGTWLTRDFATMQQQGLQFKNTLNQRATENLVADGFLRKPLEQVLPLTGSDIREPTSDVNSATRQQLETADPDEFKSKIRFEEKKSPKSKSSKRRKTPGSTPKFKSKYDLYPDK